MTSESTAKNPTSTSEWLAAVFAADLSEPAAQDVAAALAAAAGSTLLTDPPNIRALAAATGHDWQTARRATSEIVAHGLIVAAHDPCATGSTPLRLAIPTDSSAACPDRRQPAGHMTRTHLTGDTDA